MSREDTLHELLRTHGASIQRIAQVYGGPVGEEEDLQQEILLQLWRSLPKFRGDSSAGTWLYRVALNTALTWRRRATRARRGPDSSGHAGIREPYCYGDRSQEDILHDFLGSLRGPDRAVLLLYMEGLSYAEIADIVGLTVNAVGMRLHRVKQAFTDQFIEG